MSNYSCPISLEDLTKSNTNEFILIRSNNNCYYVVHEDSQHGFFFDVNECLLTRSRGQFKYIDIKHLPAKLQEKVSKCIDNDLLSDLFNNDTLNNYITTDHFSTYRIENELSRAVLNKDLIEVQRLIYWKINNINGTNTYLQTPLHLAVQYEHNNIIKYLIDNGANIHAKDQNGLTPLHIAAMKGDSETASALIKAGADKEANDNHNRTPTHWAAMRGHTETVLALAKENNSENSSLISRSLNFIFGQETSTTKKTDPKAIINSRDNDKLTPLHYSAMGGHNEAVLALIGLGENIEVKDNCSNTPLHWAVMGGHTETALALIGWGANKEAKDDQGRTPLHIAVLLGHTETALALIGWYANKEAKDDQGRTPLHLAVAQEHTETTLALIEWGANKEVKDDQGHTPLHIAASLGHTDTVNALITAGVYKEAKDNKGHTPLLIAASLGHTDTVIALIDQGAKIDQGVNFEGYWKILFQTILNGNVKAALTLMTFKTSRIPVKKIIIHLKLYVVFVIALLLAAHFLPPVFLFLTGSLLGCLGLIHNLPIIQVAALSLISIPLLDHFFGNYGKIDPILTAPPLDPFKSLDPFEFSGRWI